MAHLEPFTACRLVASSAGGVMARVSWTFSASPASMRLATAQPQFVSGALESSSLVEMSLHATAHPLTLQHMLQRGGCCCYRTVLLPLCAQATRGTQGTSSRGQRQLLTPSSAQVSCRLHVASYCLASISQPLQHLQHTLTIPCAAMVVHGTAMAEICCRPLQFVCVFQRSRPSSQSYGTVASETGDECCGPRPAIRSVL
ncbi:hypothetical protein J3F84DRAFT_378608 [Trichoderma pleuroticola]